MTRQEIHDQSIIDNSRVNIGRTNVIAVSTFDYQYFNKLPGGVHDIELIEDIFKKNQTVSIHKDHFVKLFNPSSSEFRQKIIDYIYKRSGHGDILILYFSGHGVIVGENDFGFCFKDSIIRDPGDVLSLSIVTFKDLIQTLSTIDVYPILIIDACFSSAPKRLESLSNFLIDDLHRFCPRSYALFSSSGIDRSSFDSSLGGIFTRTFHSVVMNGIDDKIGKRYPFITLELISKPIKECLENAGYPHSKLYIGPELPDIPIAKNLKFKPKKENFAKCYFEILKILWNNGNPQEVPITEFISKVSAGAYANHSKLSYEPWELITDGATNRTRKLTEKGAKFISGEVSIPRYIIKDPISCKWVPDRNSAQKYYS